MCRNDFLKVGEELELAKGKGSEEYYKVAGQLREMYHQHGEVCFLLKSIIIKIMVNRCLYHYTVYTILPLPLTVIHWH